eukprot:gene31360-24911_t
MEERETAEDLLHLELEGGIADSYSSTRMAGSQL